MKKTKLIVVAGPTASGKTSLGIEIAKAVDGEIISADSMQVYKDMRIATAAPTIEERQTVAHHLVEFLERDELFSVSDFCKYAKAAADDISCRGRVPVIVGGTGLFINSFVDNIKFTEAETDFKLRNALMKKSVDALYDELLKIDPAAAENIHKNNKTRVVRALEIYYSSGDTKSVQNEKSRLEESPYDVLYFVIGFKDRALLYNRINRRVDLMAEKGLLDEAKFCLNHSGNTSAQAIGHKELLPYFNGSVSLDEALDKLKQETRHYAKRQITWFKKRENAVWLYADEEDIAKKAVDKSREFINNG
ncbi:MAG: tRNA (adenosine(37)-N6)-dimethylallyltransferase MiaA [Eubacterium sp.]|nr:tRNA (adenosine(37)-N6)-dimethylallyltransferase MiaA [Eubacterium sp.]